MQILRIVRRASRLSARKKAAAAAFFLLALLALYAAYLQNLWLLAALLVILAAGTVIALVKVEALLRKARRAAVAAPKPRQMARQRPGALTSWGVRSGVPAARLVQRLTKLRSVDGRDVLASAATSGRWSWNEMASALEMYRLGGRLRQQVAPVLDGSPRSSLLLLADLCFRQNILEDDLLNAATLYRYAYQRLGAAPFKGKRRGEFFLDALSRTGQGTEAKRLEGLYDPETKNANDLHLYRANADNPFKGSAAADIGPWLEEVNAIYERAGLARLVLEDGTSNAFLRLTAEAPGAVSDGPLVSIIMPVYQSDDFTDRAIGSALKQTYRNIEIIIVDDGSPDMSQERLQTWADADERVKVILNGPNSGAYTSRNIGFAAAGGEFVTIFDGDDWQHPQKIELLVKAALAEKDGRLVSAPWTRADEDLFFHYRGWRGAFITPAHVSTMFHTETVRTKLGYWDSVRKAADTEFILRYRMLVNDEEPLEVTDAPLTISLVGTSNLSIDDFRLGYRSPDRVAYRDSYEHWHRQVAAGQHSGYLPFPQPGRAFPAPAKFLPQGGRAGLQLDALLVGDFGDAAGVSTLVREQLAAAAAEGSRIGLMHYPCMLRTKSIDGRFSDEFMDAFAAGTFSRVELTDNVHAETVHIYDPTAFQYTRHLKSGHTAGGVLVWAQEPPFDAERNEHQYEIATIERNLTATFGGALRWMPQNEQTLTALSLGGCSAAVDASAVPLPVEVPEALEAALESSADLDSDSMAPLTRVGGAL
ncbi:MAG: glycosyltransferase family 2 protein [Pseudarthrobacter sp.]|nr:glycosyltransferase family 2 protein [Pseudarthrobacter sp.]